MLEPQADLPARYPMFLHQLFRKLRCTMPVAHLPRSFTSSIASGYSHFPRTFMMFDYSILQKYAKMFESSPSSLPPTLLLVNTGTSLALFDKYPKAIHHFLVLPRILAASKFTAEDLTNLQTLLAKGRNAETKTLLEALKKDAEMVKEMVEKEMIKKHGYKWDVWIGFHAVPSLLYVLEWWRRTTKIPARFSLNSALTHSVTCICTSSRRTCAHRP